MINTNITIQISNSTIFLHPSYVPGPTIRTISGEVQSLSLSLSPRLSTGNILIPPLRPTWWWIRTMVNFRFKKNGCRREPQISPHLSKQLQENNSHCPGEWIRSEIREKKSQCLSRNSYMTQQTSFGIIDELSTIKTRWDRLKCRNQSRTY